MNVACIQDAHELSSNYGTYITLNCDIANNSADNNSNNNQNNNNIFNTINKNRKRISNTQQTKLFSGTHITNIKTNIHLIFYHNTDYNNTIYQNLIEFYKNNNVNDSKNNNDSNSNNCNKNYNITKSKENIQIKSNIDKNTLNNNIDNTNQRHKNDTNLKVKHYVLLFDYITQKTDVEQYIYLIKTINRFLLRICLIQIIWIQLLRQYRLNTNNHKLIIMYITMNCYIVNV